MNSTNNRFRKSERLCSRKEIERLFAGGSSVIKYPLKLISITRTELPEEAIKIMFVVPKRSFRRAHDRNRLRRRMREAYRLSKAEITEHLQLRGSAVSLALLYTSRKEEDYAVIDTAVREILERLKGKFP